MLRRRPRPSGLSRDHLAFAFAITSSISRRYLSLAIMVLFPALQLRLKRIKRHVHGFSEAHLAAESVPGPIPRDAYVSKVGTVITIRR